MTCIPLKTKRRKHHVRKNKSKSKNKNKVDENKNDQLELELELKSQDKHISDYIGRDMSGARFKKYFSDLYKKLVKLTNETENHNGFQFVTGLNEDSIPFNPKGKCKAGGIYFTDIDNLPRWLYYNKTSMVYYRYVDLPDDCRVYIEKNKFKADKIILSKRKKIKNLPLWSDEDYCLNAINIAEHKNVTVNFIKNFNNEKIQLAVVEEDGFKIFDLLDHGIKVSDEVLIAAIEEDYDVFAKLLDDGIKLSEKVQLAAVESNYRSIEDMFDRKMKVSDKVILAALNTSFYTVDCIIRCNQQVSSKVEMDENYKHGINYYARRRNYYTYQGSRIHP